MKIKAYAKINLALDVIRRRDDGYHELDMIMAPISLYDNIEVTIANEDSFTSNVELSFDEQNTIYKALVLMRKYYRINEKFCIHLDKRIPMQAGLAGGSADGAAMLKAINTLCSLQLTDAELIAIGKQIGADVPFCLMNRLSRVTGIGERLEPIQTTLHYKLLIVKPKSGVSTREAFEHIDFKKCIHPAIDRIERKIKENDESFIKLLGNTLEQPAMKLNPDIENVKKSLAKYDFDCILMSGSGSSVFAIGRDESIIEVAERELKQTYDFVERCSIL